MWTDYILTRKEALMARAMPSEAKRPLRVLVADDEDFMLQLMNRMLQTLGFEVVLAKGGMEAIERLGRSRYDLVITDLQMPDLNGHALAEWIKRNLKDLPVIIMTGNSPSSVTEYMQAGKADHWMFKPFGLSDLKMTIGDFFSAKR